jgi:hypothetical protein
LIKNSLVIRFVFFFIFLLLAGLYGTTLSFLSIYLMYHCRKVPYLSEPFLNVTIHQALLRFLTDCIFFDRQQPVSTDFTGIYINILVIVHSLVFL